MRLVNGLALLFSTSVSLVSAAQIPFASHEVAISPSATYDAPSQLVGTFSHPKFPAHALRFVQPPGDICESHGTRSWSGYLDVDLDKLWKQNDELNIAQAGKNDTGVVEHFYFWAFESRNNPKEDPTVMWLNGGPGCSSGCGMLMELGPCNARNYNSSKGPHTVWNPHSWSNNASLLFLDQPVGTGFSYASWADPEKKGKAPSRIYTGTEAGRDASAFLQLWGLHAEELFGQAVSSFHIAGESYSGRWIPRECLVSRIPL
jgi:cathepsin A (carboxypeptidase C)